MSRLYGDLCGNRGEATRQGTAASGIRSHVRGWNVGVRVSGCADDESDVFYVRATGGSHGREAERLIAIVRRDPGGSIEVEYPEVES